MCLICIDLAKNVLTPKEARKHLGEMRVNMDKAHVDRGYEFAVLPDASAEVVRLDVEYPVGSVDDPPGKEGLAHLVEHLLFDIEVPRPGGKTSIEAELGRVALELDIAFQTVAGFGRDYAKRLVLQQILESRLQDLRAKQALTYGFSVDYEPRVGGGMWRISGEVDATRADEAAKAVMQILSQLRTDPESYRAAFVLARQKVLERLLVGGTGSLGVIERLEAAARFDLPDDFYDEVAKHVAALTLEAMPAFIAAELDEKRQVFGAFGNADAVAAALAAAKSAQ
jgi:predicted Zn-dependent peptidase